MADKDDQYNDDYQFTDLDGLSPEENPTEQPTQEVGATSDELIEPNRNTVKRNALIVITIVILAMVIYKIVGSFTSEKKVAVKPVTPVIAPQVVATQPRPISVEPPIPTPSVDSKMEEKLSTLESGQQSMRSEVASINDQLGGVNNNVNTMIAKIAELSATIDRLTTKVDEQSREIEQLVIRRREVKTIYRRPQRAAAPSPRYSIQAVIPGRAWLIATNGATLTVREGTVIAGYGVVKLIDPNQGRVLTSSGQVIKFSQDDS